MKNSNNHIGSRTRDILACSAVPQLNAPQLHIFCYHNTARRPVQKARVSGYSMPSVSHSIHRLNSTYCPTHFVFKYVNNSLRPE